MTVEEAIQKIYKTRWARKKHNYNYCDCNSCALHIIIDAARQHLNEKEIRRLESEDWDYKKPM